MHRLTLTARRLGAAIGQQVADLEGIRMSLMGVQRQEQGRTLLHHADARVSMAVDPALMTLGPAEPPLQFQVVLRQVRPVTADEEARLEARHHCGEVLPNRVAVGLEAIPQRLELSLPLETTPMRRVERRIDRGDVRHPLPDGRLDLPHQTEAAIDATGQPTQQGLGPPPLRASRFRCSDCRTSPSASAIRTPGGCSGPPWSSLRMPRTAAQ
jgi:hypothetical protein